MLTLNASQCSCHRWFHKRQAAENATGSIFALVGHLHQTSASHLGHRAQWRMPSCQDRFTKFMELGNSRTWSKSIQNPLAEAFWYFKSILIVMTIARLSTGRRNKNRSFSTDLSRQRGIQTVIQDIEGAKLHDIEDVVHRYSLLIWQVYSRPWHQCKAWKAIDWESAGKKSQIFDSCRLIVYDCVSN